MYVTQLGRFFMHLARDLHVGKKVFWPWLCVFFSYIDIVVGISVLANCSDCFVYYVINFSVRHFAVIIFHGDLTCCIYFPVLLAAHKKKEM
jgi:hypothetical protein